jgi:hypothetical protein
MASANDYNIVLFSELHHCQTLFYRPLGLLPPRGQAILGR